MDNQNLFYAFDGDDIGIRHAQAILSDNVGEIQHISSEITDANAMVKQFVESNGGQMISFGGDEGVFTAPADFVNLLEDLRKKYEQTVGATLSIGYGSKPSEAGKALLAAKQTGKNKIVQYDENAEKYAQEAQQDRDSENAPKLEESEEQKKIKDVLASEEKPEEDGINEFDEAFRSLNEAHQNEDVASDKVLPAGADSAQNEPTLCEPDQEDNNLGYDSGYKNSDQMVREESYQRNDLTPPVNKKPNLVPQERTKEAVSTDIQESTRPMNEVLPDPKDEEAMDKKPAPKQYHGQAEGEGSEVSELPADNKPSDLKYNYHEVTEPQADVPIENATSDIAEETEQQDMLGDKHCASCTCGNHDDSIENVLDQHLENSKDFNEHIDNDEQDDNKEPSDTEDLLDAHLENAADLEHRMENGTSRPEDYDQESGDMGLSEEDAGEPDLSQVLQGGLDQHADSIQKEKVIQLVGQALEGFKSQKAILDKAKEQAPELHDACINMLKAMIELCSLAGIDESRAEQEVSEIEGQSGEEAQKPTEACPTCGKEDAHKEAASPAIDSLDSAPKSDSSEQNAVGQSVKKLPTKHGTPHIAKEPIPEGGINAKGQKKVTDKDGSVRFIDMKQGRVKGPSGVPVKG